MAEIEEQQTAIYRSSPTSHSTISSYGAATHCLPFVAIIIRSQKQLHDILNRWSDVKKVIILVLTSYSIDYCTSAFFSVIDISS